MEMTPSTSFELEWLDQVEVDYYEDGINSVGILEVKGLETGECLCNPDGYPWFLIENENDEKYYLDTTDKYFLKEDKSYQYRWLAWRQ